MADWWEQDTQAGGTATASNWWENDPTPGMRTETLPSGASFPMAEGTSFDELMQKAVAGQPAARQANIDRMVGTLPEDATRLEELNFKRRQELITGEPANPTGDKRLDDITRQRLAKEIADMNAKGLGPDEMLLEERYQAEQDPLTNLINAPIMRGAMTGVQNAASSIAETALRILPGEGAPSQLADKIGRQRASEAQYQAYLDQRQGAPAALPNQVTQMVGEYLPLSAAGVPAAAQVAVKGANDAYLKSDDDTYALTSGIVQGALTYAGGKLAGGTWIDMIGGKVAGKKLAPLLKGFGIESGEELGQLYGQALIDRGFGVGDGSMPTAKDAVWTLATVLGARGFGSAMSAGVEDDGVNKPSIERRAYDAMKRFAERKWPSRKLAKEAGVDQVATTAKERAKLATDIRNRLTGQQFEEQLRAAAVSPEQADLDMEVWRARAVAAGESFDEFVGKRVKGIEKTTSDNSVYMAQRQGGKPDALAQDQPTPVDTPEFKAWFGESKVADAEGKPLRVYHGTSDDFDSFNLDHKNRKDTGWLGTGVYLTTSQDIASSYANLKPGYAGKNVMALYAKVENPYYATIKDKQRLQLISNRSLAEGREAADAWTAELKAKGHDGVILRFNESEVGKANASEEIVVFSPSAVKSATGNSGKFDPNDPSILAQKTAPKPRGEIQFHKDDGRATIRLFEGANESTFIHESAHLFRRDLKGSDLKEAERWAGVVDGDWGRKNEKGIAEAEEKFARGFERYLYDGVAPNKQLESIFARFKAALSKIYSVLAKSPINIDISPEMRTVFDRLLTPAETTTQTQGATNGQVQTEGRAEGQVARAPHPLDDNSPLELGTFPPPNPDMLSQAPVSPDLAAKNASMDEARAAMGLPAINQPAAPGANMPHHIAEQEAIRQRIPERASGIVMDYLSDKRKEPLNQLETAGLAVYGDRLNEAYARLQEDVNNLTLDEGERMTKAAEMERIEQDFDLLSRAMRQSGTAQSLAFSQRKHVVGSDYRPLSVESRAAAAKGKKLTAREKQKLNKTAKEIKAADEKLEAQKQKEAAKVETTREKIKKTVKKLKEYVAKAKLPTDLNRYAQDLAKQYLAEGVTGRRELIDKVQKAVREIFPETQRRQVIDAISGYGDFKELSKDEASVRLRDLKGQLQQISKLKDMSEGKAPSKTGMERRDPSDTERALIKEVNEAKKEGGYEVTDPAKQLASALSTIKTRLRNQIKDLQAQIDSRQKLIKQKKAAPSDEETKRLTEERDALKTQFDDIFGKEGLTDAQRIANAERATKKSIEELQKRLDAGDFSPRPQYAGNPVPESLAKLREKAAELRAQYNSSKPVSLDEKKRLEQSIARTEKSISELERRINQGDYSEAPKRPPASSDQLKALKDRAAELRAQYNSGKPVSLDEKKRLEKATLAAEKAVAELERRLKEGDFSTKPKRPPATSQNIQVLKDRADALRKKYAATNPNPPALEAAKERLAVLQAHLKNGTVPDVRPRQQSKNPVMQAIQQRLADARKELAQSEPSQRARLRKSIGELQAKLEAGQFALPDGAPRPASPEIERLQYERDKLRRKIRAEINALRPQSVWGHIASPFNAARSIITTLDFPPVFRQGAFIALGNPVRAAKATAAGFRGMFSDMNARKQLAELGQRPNAPLYARAKLYLADMDGSPSAREEAFVGRLVEKIPGVRSIIAASERNYTVFLNRLRADTFDAMAASLARNGEPTMAEAQAIAKFINVATGRGDFGQFEAAMTGLAPVFFSPRYVASRFQLLAGQPLYGGTMDTRKLIAKEYGKALVGIGVIYALAMAAGAELEDDPTESDFGKIKLGNTRMDPLGGLSQTAVFTSRMGKGLYKTGESWVTGRPRKTEFTSGETMTAGRFLRSKLSPIAATMVNVASGETAGGDKVTPKQLFGDLTVPLSFREFPLTLGDIKKAIEEQRVPPEVALWLVSLFGVGMQTYDN